MRIHFSGTICLKLMTALVSDTSNFPTCMYFTDKTLPILPKPVSYFCTVKAPFIFFSARKKKKKMKYCN